MEKYRPFADPGTGTNPFVPPWSQHKPSIPGRLLKVLVCFPLALVRLALFVVALVWLAIVQGLCGLIPIGVVRYPIYRIFSHVGCVLALLALGIVPLGEKLADHRRLKIAPPKSNSASTFDAKRGTLVFANQQGITDILYLCMKLCPGSFLFPSSDGTLVETSLLGALSRAGARRLPLPSAKPVTLAEVSERARSGFSGPVVVFPEGARTNGSCILAWKDRTFEGVKSFDKPVGTALVALEYSKTGAYTPQHTVGTAFRHAFWLCMQPWNTLRATWLSAGEVAVAVKGKESITEQAALIRSVHARMLTGAVEVEVSAGKFPEFMAFWDASQKKRYTKAEKEVKKRA